MSLLSKPVFYDPYSGTVTRQNPPVPQRAVEARATKASGASEAAAGLKLSGVGRVDWEQVLEHIAEWNALEGSRVRKPRTGLEQSSQVALFAQHFRLTGKAEKGQPAPLPIKAIQMESAFVASNAKTNKPRVDTGRDGEIVGLALFPHFYANLLPSIPEKFLDENGVVHVPVVRKTHPEYAHWRQVGADLREFFNSFVGTKPDDVVAATDIPRSNLLNFCVGASAACRSTCLVLSGNNPASTDAVQKKANLTQALLADPELFVAGLFIGVDDLARRNAKSNIDTVLRLNMLSDIPWYATCPEFLEELSRTTRGAERVYFYDYTKLAFWLSEDYRMLGQGTRLEPGEKRLKPGQILDLTYSFSGENKNTRHCREALDLQDSALGYPQGVRIALAFAPADPDREATFERRTTWDEILATGMVRNKGGRDMITLPELGTREIVDGDGSDYRIDDPGGCIVALNFKQPSLTEEHVPGFEERTRTARQTFTAKVPGGAQWFSKKVIAEGGVENAQEKLKKAQASFARKPTPEAEEKLEKAEAALLAAEQSLRTVMAAKPDRRAGHAGWVADEPKKNPLALLSTTGDAPDALASGSLRYQMFQVGDLLIGPHVPTVLND